MVQLTVMVKNSVPLQKQNDPNLENSQEVKDDEILVIVPPKPWEKQIGESDRAFSGFVVYRDLPPNLRNYQAVVEQLYPGSAPWMIQKITGWAKKYNWEYRAGEWQIELDRERRAAQLETVKDMTTRHIQAAMVMQEKGLNALRALSHQDILTAADIRLLITEGAKLERTARGLKSERTDEPDGDESSKLSKPAGPASLSSASDDELERIDQAAQKHLVGEGAKTSS